MKSSLSLRSTSRCVCGSIALMLLGGLAAIGAPAKPAGLSPAAALRARAGEQRLQDDIARGQKIF